MICAGKAGSIKEAPIIEQIDDLFAAVATLNKKVITGHNIASRIHLSLSSFFPLCV